MCKAEVIAIRRSEGIDINVNKGRECKGLIEVGQNEKILLYVQARGLNPLRTVINEAYIIATARGLEGVARDLRDRVKPEANRVIILSDRDNYKSSKIY